MLISMYYTVAVVIINKSGLTLKVDELQVDSKVDSENPQDHGKQLENGNGLVIILKRKEQVTAYHHKYLITDGAIYARYLCYYNLQCVAKVISFTSHD